MTAVIHRIRMMSIIQTVGHSQDEKKANHERIVEIAAARMRQSGTEAPGVAEIMREAGLTHGGFYKHFSSRDELVAEAAEHAFASSARRTDDALDGAGDPLAAFVDFYLSAAHRDGAADGCAVAGRPMPALLTTICTSPSFRAAAATPSVSVTSKATGTRRGSVTVAGSRTAA